MSNSFEKIKRFNSGLLPEMTDIKYQMMSKNIYRFFRGANHLYYENLSKVTNIAPTPKVWICGDLHTENFGSYKGDNRLVYFDLNDFDETILAPASWELIRFVSCIFIAFENLDIEKKKAQNMAKLFLKRYSEVLVKGKPLYIESQTAEGIVKRFLTVVEKRNQKLILKKRTVKENNKRQLKVNNKQIQIDKQLKTELRSHLTHWILNNSTSPYNFEVVDIAFRRAGLGSLGLKRYVALLKSTNEKEKYIIVDMKQSRQSSLKPFITTSQPKWKNEAERIITIQERMQNVSPALLSSSIFKNEDYVLQELQPTKDRLNFERIKHDYRSIYQAINDMAVLTASSQLRSAARQGAAGPDDLVEFGQEKDWQQNILELGVEQSKILKADYRSFCEDLIKSMGKESIATEKKLRLIA